jgi:hypothetical protein
MTAEQLQDLLLVKDLRPALGRLYRQGRLARQQIQLSQQDILAILNHYQIDLKKGLFTFLILLHSPTSYILRNVLDVVFSLPSIYPCPTVR